MLRKRYLREKLIFYFPSEKLNFASSHVLNTGTNVYIYHGQSRSYAILLANAASQRAQDKAYSDFFWPSDYAWFETCTSNDLMLFIELLQKRWIL